MAKTRIDLRLVLPDAPDAADACNSRLISAVEALDSAEQVHLADQDGVARLCVHYDPERVGLSEIEAVVRRAGVRLHQRYGHLLWRVPGLTRPRRARLVGAQLQALPGVVEAQASVRWVRVEYERNKTDLAAVEATLSGLGLSPQRGVMQAASSSALDDDTTDDGGQADPHDHAEEGHAEGEAGHTHAGPLGQYSELAVALLSAALLAVGFGLESLELLAPVPLVLYLGVYLTGGWSTLRETIDNLRLGKVQIESLMLVAAIGAAILGEWAEGGLLLVLFSLGHALEHYAMGRARRSIEALAELAPKTATVRREGQLIEIPIEALLVGDTAIVRPNERLPSDGFVTLGSSSVNQAPVTGESVPVDKLPVPDVGMAAADPEGVAPAHRLFAGTINGAGALEMFVTRLAADTTLARVVQMVNEAETQKSPTQRLTDRFERVFVPTVIGLSLVVSFAWLVLDEPVSASFYRAMAVLVAASPCALAIATPSAVLSAVARAGKGGVLFKGGAPLESLGAVSAIAFDKTGTLTIGEPKVTDVVAWEGVEEAELLRVAGAVEALSDHPLASAVTELARERLGGALPSAVDLEGLIGQGVTAMVEGVQVHIGKLALFDAVESPAPDQALRERVAALQAQGRTTMVVRAGGRYLGILGLMDTPREEAAAVIERLRSLGVGRMILISGDSAPVAMAVATRLGLDQGAGDLMPEDKVRFIQSLGESGGGVAMVGDGVNDAPAMAHATVGIAMGAAGSDVALETADVALMADDLQHLVFAVGLSRATSRIIRQNLWLSLGMVGVLLPATLLGLGIGPAVMLHEGSTLVVVFNALRLLVYEEKR